MTGGRTLIAAVGDYSLDQIRSRSFYACPESYNRDRVDYLGIYHSEPTSAIIHYAEVEKIRSEVQPNNEGILTRMDRLRMFPDHFDEPARVFYLDELKELETPVKSDNRWVQGAIYCNIDDLRRAEYVDDLITDRPA